METVDLPVQPPLEPMLAKAQTKVPDEAGVWSYEPKWDGFRALVFRDGDDVVLQSRNGKELGRYFPELVDACVTSWRRAASSTARSSCPEKSAAASGWTGNRESAHPPRRQPRQNAGRADARRTSSVSTRWPPATSR